MKYLVIILFLIPAFANLTAQEVISPGGEAQAAAGVEVSWTLGEAVIDTYIGGSSALTQGFQQTKLTIIAVGVPLMPGLEIKVFPNPTPDIVTIHFSEYVEDSRYWLYDLRGKLLENKLIHSADTEINMAQYASGQYILKLTQGAIRPIQTFHIVKY
jgi:hypothetical protein